MSRSIILPITHPNACAARAQGRTASLTFTLSCPEDHPYHKLLQQLFTVIKARLVQLEPSLFYNTTLAGISCICQQALVLDPSVKMGLQDLAPMLKTLGIEHDTSDLVKALQTHAYPVVIPPTAKKPVKRTCRVLDLSALDGIEARCITLDVPCSKAESRLDFSKIVRGYRKQERKLLLSLTKSTEEDKIEEILAELIKVVAEFSSVEEPMPRNRCDTEDWIERERTRLSMGISSYVHDRIYALFEDWRDEDRILKDSEREAKLDEIAESVVPDEDPQESDSD